MKSQHSLKNIGHFHESATKYIYITQKVVTRFIKIIIVLIFSLKLKCKVIQKRINVSSL
jgi:hypothetical protein